VIGQLTWSLLLRSAMGLFVIAALDYMFQKMQLEKQLKMTKQEVKEDYKRTEGDPLVKSKIRQKQREMSKQRMMLEVPKADVVVTNPTHFAVALKYDSKNGSAPIVVAKGRMLIAQRIKEIAAEAGFPLWRMSSLRERFMRPWRSARRFRRSFIRRLRDSGLCLSTEQKASSGVRVKES